MLSPEQENVRQTILSAKIALDTAKTAYWGALKQCTNHVYKNVGDSAECAICETDGGWWCPDSSDHVCHYSDDECCDHCGQPEERK